MKSEDRKRKHLEVIMENMIKCEKELKVHEVRVKLLGAQHKHLVAQMDKILAT